MAITRINSVLVKHGRIMFAVITAIIIVAFVWFFTPGTSGSIFFDRDPNSPNAAAGEIFGTKIRNRDIKDAARDYTLVRAMYAGVSPKEEMFDFNFELGFQLAAANAAAKHLGASATDAEVAEAIRRAPAFQKDGKFSLEAYKAYEKDKLIPEGFNAMDLENAVRTRIAVEGLAAAAGEAAASQAEIDEFLLNCLEKHDVMTVLYRADDFKSRVQAGMEDVRKYYDANKKLFMTPERFKMEAVLFPYSDYEGKYTPSAKDIQSWYDSHKTEYSDGKGGTRPLDRTLSSEIASMLKTAEASRKAGEAASAFREILYQATANIAGDKDAYLAEYRKAAEKAKYKIIDTGWFSAGAKKIEGLGAEPLVKTAVMNLAESSVPVTDPVDGEKGVYVAALTGLKRSKQAKFEDVSADVRLAYINEKSLALADEAMRALAAKLADPKTAGAGLSALAGNAKIEHPEPFALFPGSEKLAPEVVMLGSSTPAGTLSKSYPTEDGVAAVWVIRRISPSAKEIEANRTLLSMQYRFTKKQLLSDSLYSWLNKNMKKYIPSGK